MKRFVIIALALMIAAVPAFAELVRIECNGTVEYNQVNSGIFADVNSGDVVHATFCVDSDDFIDSATYNVRSYPVILSTFELTIGSVGPVPLVMPQPNGETTYFNLRDNDPVADGMFIANATEWPSAFPSLDVPGGIDPYFNFHWEVGYTGDTFGSLDILDAVGSYDYTGLTSFYTVIGDAWADAIGLEYGNMAIYTEGVAVEQRTLSSVKSLFE